MVRSRCDGFACASDPLARRHGLTRADFGGERWRHLVGGAPGYAVTDERTCCYPESKYSGWDDHVVTDVPGASHDPENTVVLPYQLSRFSNDTEEHKPIAVGLVLPIVST